MQPQCSIPDCVSPSVARGWCSMHYHRWQRHSDPTVRIEPTLQPAEVRFWAKVDPCRTDGCAIWIGAHSGGYGSFTAAGGGSMRAHQFLVGKAPDGLQWDHLCRNRSCVWPTHLEAVTGRENVRRGQGPTARYATKTHCPLGHEYTPENTWTSKVGSRRCRICSRARNNAQYYRKRALVNEAKELGIDATTPAMAPETGESPR